MGPKHPTPRLFILRHGETEWSLSGKHTGSTDIPLTAAGEARITATGSALVGPDRLIVGANIAPGGVYVSPRRRAQRTLHLLLGSGAPQPQMRELAERATVTPDVREWEYGEYEGRTSAEIAKERAAAGLAPWEIWRDGCPGGEGPEQITARVDAFIALVRERHHRAAFAHISAGSEGRCPPCDVLVVAHGHILRALAARWVGRSVRDNPGFLLEAGGVGCLSYEHHSIDEPAILLGGAFVVDVAQSAEANAKADSKTAGSGAT